MLIKFFIGDEDTGRKSGKRSRASSLTDEQTRLPSITANGIRLGTPVAREAAKSFWSMDMYKTSVNRMAFYADCENHSEASLVSEDSGFQSRAPSERATPTTAQLPLLTTSAPSSPCSPRQQAIKAATEALYTPDLNTLRQPVLSPVSNSPLLVARKEKEILRLSSIKDNNSSSSLTGSSKTISPSLSHILLPRRQHRRSLSAGYRYQKPLHSPAHKKLRQANSDSSVRTMQQDTSLFLRLTEFQRNLNSV